MDRALVKTPYPDSQLPSGFRSAKVGSLALTREAHDRHLVGQVRVEVRGPDLLDGIGYLVFARAADARSALARAGSSDLPRIGGVPGYSPSGRFDGSVAGKDRSGNVGLYRTTSLIVQDGNVLVTALNEVTKTGERGNPAAALALLHSAVRHLHVVKR